MTMGTRAGAPGWERSRGWGWIWGDGDERGALNALTEASVVAALSLARQGKVYDLGIALDRDSYVGPAHAKTQVLTFRTPDGMTREGIPGFEDAGGVGFNTSLIQLSDHAGSQIDGLCHATYGTDRHWYNGATLGEFGRDFGPERSTAHTIPPVICPATLIDVAAAKGVDDLPTGTPVTVDDLRRALDRQGSQIQVGDAVFLRTGVLRHWGANGSDHAALAATDAAGLTLDSARWLVEEQGAILLGADSSTVEVAPPVDGDNSAPVHKYALVDQGIHLAELFYLEDLSADGVYRFCLIALAPKVRGATAGFAMRPIAVI
jgi:kynurenine formamidase